MRPIRCAVLSGALLTTLTSFVSAQTVIGRAIDAATKNPTASVLVELLDSTSAVHKHVLTDTTGWFRIRANNPGTYQVRSSGLGYALVVSQPLVLEQALQIELEITLQPEAVALDPVRVVAERSFRRGRLAEYYDRLEWTKRTGFGRIYTRQDIETNNPFRISQLWQTVVRRNCQYTYFLDGMQVPGDEIDMTVIPDEVEGIEIYRSALEVPVEYQRVAPCGAVMVWLRRDTPPGRTMTWRRALLTGGALVLLGVIVNALVW